MVLRVGIEPTTFSLPRNCAAIAPAERDLADSFGYDPNSFSGTHRLAGERRNPSAYAVHGGWPSNRSPHLTVPSVFEAESAALPIDHP